MPAQKHPVGEQSTGEVHRNAFPVAAWSIEAAPQPLQALIRRGSDPARCTCVVLWWEVSPVFTTD